MAKCYPDGERRRGRYGDENRYVCTYDRDDDGRDRTQTPDYREFINWLTRNLYLGREPRGYRLTLKQGKMILEDLVNNRRAERHAEDGVESEWGSPLCIIGCGCE